MHWCYEGLLTVVAILAWSSFMSGGLVSDDISRSEPRYPAGISQEVSSLTAGDEDQIELHRSLRLDRFYHFQRDTPRNITIYLGKNYRGVRINPAYSIFHTDVLTRYGSGRVDYIIHHNVMCGNECIHEEELHPSPCLLVSRGRECRSHILQCQYPQCKHMITNDETCRFGVPEVREYRSDYLPGKGYLPLGMRLDTWESFQKRQLRPEFYLRPASERKFAFNAVFSKDSNIVRAQVTNIIEEQNAMSNLTTFISIAKEWNAMANHPTTPQIYTDDYVDVLLESVFTLTPPGHNPECFRLYEAVEAGTIPVLSKRDLFIGNTGRRQCKDSLHHWHDAPMLVLNDWKDLYPTVQGLLADPEKLNDMQIKLREWYDKSMRTIVGKFEDFMLDAHEQDMNTLKIAG